MSTWPTYFFAMVSNNSHTADPGEPHRASQREYAHARTEHQSADVKAMRRHRVLLARAYP